MPTTETEEYVKRAEECLRLAGACIAESNRQILIYAAVHWRMLAEEAAAKSVNGPNLTRQIQPQALRMMSLKTASCEPPAALRPSDQF